MENDTQIVFIDFGSNFGEMICIGEIMLGCVLIIFHHRHQWIKYIMSNRARIGWTNDITCFKQDKYQQKHEDKPLY